MGIYLDTCCWNRLYDDLSVLKNRKQAVAILRIIKWARQNGVTIWGSDALEQEIAQLQTADPKKYALVSQLYRRIITKTLSFVDKAFGYVEPLAKTAGIIGLDVHHLAFAVGAGADYLITTDEKFIARASGLNVSVRVIDPLNFTLINEEVQS